jgi:CHAT domain-containing protein
MLIRYSDASLARVGILCWIFLWAGAGISDASRQDATQAAEKKERVSASQTRSSVALAKAKLTFEKAAALRDKQTGRDLQAAIELFRTSASLFAAAHSYQEASDAHAQIGDIHFTLGQYVDARSSYNQALKLGQDAEKRCHALSRIARSYAATGPLSFVQRSSDQAFNFCQNLSPSPHAEGLEARGEALDFAGERLKSADAFREAGNLFASVKDYDGQAQALMMLAYIDLFSGDRQAQGVEAAEQALRLWSTTGYRYGLARMRSVLGTFAYSRGEFETAHCNYSVARPVFHDLGNKDEEASLLNGLGSVSLETGDWQTSLEYYRRARMMFASVHDRLGQHEAVVGMGQALVALKDYTQFLQLYPEEVRLARQTGNPVPLATSMANMASAYAAQNKVEQAEALYRASLKANRAAHNLLREGDVLISLGRLQAKRGKYHQALTSLEEAHSLAEQTSQIEEIAKIQYELASVYYRLNRVEDAQSAIEKTIDIIEKQRVSISQFDSRASYFASVHRYYALYIQILMARDRGQPNQGFADKAFDAAEKSKVRSLLDLLTTSAQDAPCDELLERQLHEGRQEQASDAAPKLIDADLPVGDEKVSTTSSPTSTLTLKQVQDEIDSGTTLLEYALGEQRSFLWVIDRDQVTSRELPPSGEIRHSVENFRHTLAPPEYKEGESALDYQARARKISQQSQAYARQLSRLLLGDVDLAKTRRILIVPDGALQHVPFAALPVPDSRSGNKPLISTQEIVILPSASVLATLRKADSNRRSPAATAAIFADPVFEPDDPRLLNPRPAHKPNPQERPAALDRAIRDIGGHSYIPRLPASRNEADTIAKILRSQDPQGVHVALDFDANRDSLLAQGISQYRLVHFATHGVLDTRHPESSGLILSLVDRKGRKEDGYLRLGDIYKLKLSADLVVLSSCDSALGRDLESEGIIGLPRGFLYAGAKSVIATLWKVNDEASAKLMAGLYARLGRGESPSAALRGAQLDMVRDQQWSNPYYWAAFTLQGEYR